MSAIDLSQLKTDLRRDCTCVISGKICSKCRAALAIEAIEMDRDNFITALRAIANSDKAAINSTPIIGWSYCRRRAQISLEQANSVLNQPPWKAAQCR